MRGVKLATDPLWKCLCPSWNAVTSTRISKHAQKSTITQCRDFSSTVPRRAFGRYWDRRSTQPKLYVRADPERSTDELYKELEKCAWEGRIDACRNRAIELVRKGEQPNVRIYNALILANTDPWLGAAWRVHNLLKEMEEEGLELDQDICRSVLQVLAVHPDNLLRSDLQRFMRNNWIPVDAQDAQFIVVGLLREGCFEMALEKLESMAREGAEVKPWLLDMFAYMLAEVGEMDTVHRMLRSRWDDGERSMSTTLWFFVLDMASEARHHSLTEFVWRTQVLSDNVPASSGMCYNILSTASRAGDPGLALEVLGYIARRKDKNTVLHYQLLIDAYMAEEVPDVGKALSVLGIMSLEKLQPTVLQTRSLYFYLKKSSEITEKAWEILQSMRDEGKNIPIAALNLIIECYGEQKNMNGAMQVYKQIHTFTTDTTKSLANTETFNSLLRACREAEATAEAGFLISEMLALSVEPNALTYDRLVLIFSRAAEVALDHSQQPGEESQRTIERQQAPQYVDIAYQYFDEIYSLGWTPRAGTLRHLALSLARLGDARCWDILQYATEVYPQESKAWSYQSMVAQAWKDANMNFMAPEVNTAAAMSG